MKRCTACKTQKPLSEFRFENRAKGVYKCRCNPCENQRQRDDRKRYGEARRRSDNARYHKDPVRVRKTIIRRTYGLTETQAERVLCLMYCELCGQENGERRLVVDHCHDTKKNRGVLCDNCNIGLGKFQDNPALLRQAAEYLEKGGSGFFQ